MTPDQAIARLDAIIKEHNPCGFHQVDGVTKCVGVRNNFVPCCHGCGHLTSKGCGVQSVACKMYFCDSAWPRLPEAARLEVIKIVDEYKLPLKWRHTGHLIRDKWYAINHDDWTGFDIVGFRRGEVDSLGKPITHEHNTSIDTKR